MATHLKTYAVDKAGDDIMPDPCPTDYVDILAPGGPLGLLPSVRCVRKLSRAELAERLANLPDRDQWGIHS